MSVNSLNNTLVSTQEGDHITPSQKQTLLNLYNSKITTGIENHLGYRSLPGSTVPLLRTNVTVSNFYSGYNERRRLVRMNDGTIVAMLCVSDQFFLFKSVDNGASFSQFFVNTTWYGGIIYISSLTTDGVYLYLLIAGGSQRLTFLRFNTSGTELQSQTLVNGDLTISNTYCDIVYATDNTLHATWSAWHVNDTRINCLYYVRGTISGDGSVTWGAIEKVTEPFADSLITTWRPTLIVTPNRNVGIFFELGAHIAGTAIGYVTKKYTTKSIDPIKAINTKADWGSTFVVPLSSSGKRAISATVDSSGVIHAVYHSDASGVNNIYYTKSTDDGVTWSPMTQITTGLNGYSDATITCDQNNKLYVYFVGNPSGTYIIYSTVYNGTSWSAITQFTAPESGHSLLPSLCDNFRTFTTPLSIWGNMSDNTFKFSGAWEKTVTNGIVSVGEVSNKKLIDAIITMIVNGGV